MRDENSLLPSHMRGAEHLTAFEKIWHERVENLDTSELMMYLIDACSTKALPFLADQFGIITLRSWKLATNDAERRELIKNAIQTRSVVGTVSAVKAAIASLGFDPSHLVERCGTDPVFGWAQFKMAFDASELAILDGPLMDLLTQLINDAKPARCQYLGLDYTLADIVDTADPMTEIIEVSVSAEITDTLDLHGFKYDGAHKYDGSMKYRRGVEDVQFVIV